MTATHTKRVGIFGGSFNPPHIAHLIVADIVRQQFDLDAILWIPTSRNPLKDSTDLADARDRLAMTRLAIEGNGAFDLCEIEIGGEAPSYTVDTVRSLQEMHGDTKFYLIVGSDTFADLRSWREPDALAAMVSFIVFPRLGRSKEAAKHGATVLLADAPRLEISSTEIRRRIREGRSCRYMVPESVYAYIRRRGLYQ